MPAELPVRMFALDDHRTPKRLADKMAAERDKAIDALRYAQDWTDFKRRSGFIAGLEAAIATCNEINEELSGKQGR
jgi:hypothetical protein